MKKQALSFFAIFLMLVGLCVCNGCSAVGRRPASLQDSLAIPEDGVVSQTVFDEIRQKNQVVKFCGTAGGLRYEWTVFGSEIKEPAALNLGIEITKATASEIVFRFLSTEDFGFTPALSLYLQGGWNADEGTVYRLVEKGEERVGKAVLTVGDAWILNLAPSTQTGILKIRASAAQENVSDGTDTTAADDSAQTTDSASGEPAKPSQKKHTCVLEIECSSILNHLADLEPSKLEMLPKDGILLAALEVEFEEGESVYDLLRRVCRENGIPMEASFTPMYNSTYIEGIGNLYEFDCGSGSGWMYCVDGWYPNYGCSLYRLQDGQKVRWRYTCDLGRDIGGEDALAG